MLSMFLTLLAGMVGGGLVGGLLSWRLCRRYTTTQPALPAIDPDLDSHIEQAAQQWAVAHNQPAAAPLVAGKLRLAYALRLRREQQGSNSGRWSRWR
jgi:hypothetical protein